MTDTIAEFLKRGGKIKSCPTAATAEGTAVVPEADRKRLAEHLDERKEKVGSSKRATPSSTRIATAACLTRTTMHYA